MSDKNIFCFKLNYDAIPDDMILKHTKMLTADEIAAEER